MMPTATIAAKHVPNVPIEWQPERGSGRLAALAARLPAWVWAIAAFAWIAAGSLLRNLAGLEQNLGDTDDATRLVQVRDLLAGSAWYTPTLARLAGGEAIVSHWSRLIDAPLAGLMQLLALAMPMPAAEIGARALWPLLVLLPLVVLLARTVETMHGRVAAIVAVAQFALCPFAIFQFSVGRIDHHNAQILGSVGAVLLLWSGLGRNAPAGAGWSWPGNAVLAGMLAGIAVGIGYEALPLVAVGTAAAVVWSLRDATVTSAVAAYAASLTATLALVFLATLPPARWLDVRCDTLSANLVVLVAIGAAALAVIAHHGRHWSWPRRLLVLGLAGAAGIGCYGLLEPVCLKGPFAQVPAALGPAWLDHVEETMSLWSLAQSRTAEALACMIVLSAACCGQAMRWLRTRSPADAFLGMVLVVMTLSASAQIKFLPYASILALVSMATVVAGLPGSAQLSASTVRLAATVTSSPLIVMLAIGHIVSAVAPANPVTPSANGAATASAASTRPKACFEVATVHALAALPRRLIVSAIDLGPYIVATSAHTVLAGPYHRIAAGILKTQAIWAAPPAEAQRLLRDLGAGYVVICAGAGDVAPAALRPVGTESNRPGDLLSILERGEVPAFLEAVGRPGSPLRVFRLLPSPAG